MGGVLVPAVATVVGLFTQKPHLYATYKMSHHYFDLPCTVVLN